MKKSEKTSHKIYRGPWFGWCATLLLYAFGNLPTSTPSFDQPSQRTTWTRVSQFRDAVFFTTQSTSMDYREQECMLQGHHGLLSEQRVSLLDWENKVSK